MRLSRLLLFGIVACGDSQAPSTAGVTSVLVSGPTSLQFLASATLTASVQGTGAFSPIVNWVINSGGGHLSAATGASVQYTAPLVLDPSTVEIYAVADADHSKVGKLSVAITPAPAGVVAIAGTYIGDLHDYEFRRPVAGQPLNVIVDRHVTLSYVVSQAGPHLAKLTGWLNGDASCTDGVPFTVNDDGTLIFAQNFACPSYYIPYPGGGGGQCQVGQYVFNGAGTWDYLGNLQFVLHMDLSSCLGDVYGDQTFAGHKQ